MKKSDTSRGHIRRHMGVEDKTVTDSFGSFKASRLSRLLIVGSIVCLVLMLCLLSACNKNTPGNEKNGNAASTEAVVFETDQEDRSTFTLMVYMIGSDLESMGGSATADIKEMLAAQKSGNLNIVLQTGGASAWESELTGKDNTCRRFVLNGEEPELLEDLGIVNMSEPASLTDFINFAAEKYPADRCGLILWDHGAGTLMGYGMDENFEDVMLEIGELKQALSDSGKHFYFIGFDACLMSTVEVASALEEYTDYLVASEETEPSGGWAYTPFLSQLAARPGIDMHELAPRIVDDFVNDPTSTKYDNNTLAVLELSKLSAVRGAVQDFLKTVRDYLPESYDLLSLCRSRVRSFGGGMYEQVDLLDLLEELPRCLTDPELGGDKSRDLSGILTAADTLKAALSDTIVYTRSVDSRSGGLALYFPYLLLDRYESVSGIMQEVGYDKSYFDFFDGFLSYVVAEQERADIQPVASGVKAAPWYHPEETKLKEDTYIDPSTLVVKELESMTIQNPDGSNNYIDRTIGIDLRDDQWMLIDQVENVIYVDTEEYGRLELGCRNLQNMINGDPYYDFDGTWMALEDRIVPYYEAFYTLNAGDESYSYGFIPAELEGRDISIVVWYSVNGLNNGVYVPKVLGYRREPVMSFAHRRSVIDISAGLTLPDKGVHSFKEGDKIRLYAYDENGGKVYPYDLPIIYHEIEGLSVKDESPVESFAGGRFNSMFQQIALRDIFNNTYLCEGVDIDYNWQEELPKMEVNSPGYGAGPYSWEGATERFKLVWDYDVTLSFPSDLFKQNEGEFGEPDIVSRDGKVKIYLETFGEPDDYTTKEKEFVYWASQQDDVVVYTVTDENGQHGLLAPRDFSLESYSLANGMSGQRFLYHDSDGRWRCGQLAGSTRMRGGIYGFSMEVFADEDPDEELMNAIFYIGNSLEISYE
ncbi:clostripain-related cysteine peptidase [Oribacterium sp. NK2B42]|uniref:clostripain-related cysteine peptidase n=1 Tax=Oribacterium sp. NK2B42 TaxID=689781 RepID=UPI00041C9A30|nr:clostripain-related cysteine peptidase [Oribacterium sp. NK2B42]